MTDIELIKSKIDIVGFISEYIQLKKAGRNFKALCPFHSERTPSFVVSPERQSWHCFGACNQGGDVVSFLQKWENIEFVEALRILAKRVGVVLSYIPTDTSRLKEKLYEINHLAAEFYHYLLTSHKLGERARNYLSMRHIKNETVKTFTLGYAPNSWDGLLRYLSKKAYQVFDIHTAGLLVKSEKATYYDRFRGRLMFTLKDHRGNVIGFAGRKLPPEEDREAKYVNTSETPIYIKGNTLYGLDVTKEAIKKEKTAVVVEGEFDLLSSFQTGVGNVVAIKGSALTEGQMLLLKRFCENLVLALDSDLAGNEAAKRGIEIAESNGLTVRVAKLPIGKDPAECIEKDPHLWKSAVKAAVPIYDFIINNALEKYPDQDAVSKKKIGSQTIPFLAKIENPIVASHYVKYLAKQMRVGEEAIELAIRQFQKKQEEPFAESRVFHSSQSREMLLEEHLLSLIIQSDNPSETLSSVMEILSPDDFSQLPVKKIIQQLLIYQKDKKKFKIKNLNPLLTPQVTPTFDRAFMVDIDNLLAEKSIFNRELIHTAKEVKRLSLRRRINNLSTKIRQEEEQENEDKTQALREELRSLLWEIREIDRQN